VCADLNASEYREYCNHRIVRTAIGLRFQLFSPSPATNGSTRRTTIRLRGQSARWVSRLTGQEGEQRIQPQKEKVRPRSSLDNRRIRPAARTKGTKIDRADSDRKKNETGEQYVLPHRARHERTPCLCVNSRYSCKYVAREHTSWHGHSLIPNFSTMSK